VLSRAAVALGLNHRPVAGLFGMTVAVTLVLGLVYLSHSFLGTPEWTGFRFGKECAVPEILGYLFAGWAAGLALYLAVAERQAVLAAWSAVFGMLLADDYFRLHERVAQAVSTNLAIPATYAQPVGEVVWLGGVGLVLATAIAVGHRFAAREWRAASRVLTVLLGLLVLCGVVVDAAHALLAAGYPWNVMFIVLEDGGELLLLAVAVTFLYGLTFCDHQPTAETLARRWSIPRPAAFPDRRHRRTR
jgi:uncharacterized membrane protein